MRMKKVVLMVLMAGFVGGLAAAETSALKASVKVGTGIEKRDLVGEAVEFPAGSETLVAWSLVEGAATPTEIKHVWLLDGKEVASIPLNVQATRFRTYSRKNINGAAGAWTVKVLDAEGTVLATTEFKTVASPQ